jgi:VanZ family protein
MKGRCIVKKALLMILCLLWIGMIFHLSGEPGKVSNQKSLAVVDYIKRLYLNSSTGRSSSVSLENKEVFSSPEKARINTNNETAKDKKLNVIVRKSGHFFEYMVLSIILGSILIRTTEDSITGIINVLFICLIIAVFDEYYQSFTGRTSKVSDVLIDFFGGLLGVFLCTICQSLRRAFFKWKVEG